MSRRDQLLSFGRAVKAARTAAGLTQQELADTLSVRRNMVSQWETGMTGAREETVSALERVLNVPDGLAWHLGFGPGPSQDAIQSAAEGIKGDPELSAEAKRILLAAYEAAKGKRGS